MTATSGGPAADFVPGEAAGPPLKLGIVVPCYNAETWIRRALASLLDAAPADAVTVVVDDGSTDGSAAAVEGFGRGVILERQANAGACRARNRGMEIAADRGATHVIFFDADDYVEGPMLTGAMAVAARTHADLILCEMTEETEDGRHTVSMWQGEVAPEAFFHGWWTGGYLNPSAVVWKIALVRAVGGWDESLAQAQDLDITLRAMFLRPLIVKNDEGLAVQHRVNPASITKTVSRATIESRLRVLEDLLDRARGTPFEASKPEMLPKVYTMARRAFQNGQPDLGRRAMARLRREGGWRHHGTAAHVWASRVLGLERKVRLWGN